MAPPAMGERWIDRSDCGPFREESFDVTGYVSTSLQGSKSKTASQEVKSLSEGLQAVESSLRAEIADRLGDLVQQVDCVETTGSIITKVKEDVKTVQDVMHHLRVNVQEPQRELKALTKKLRAVLSSLRLVKHVAQHLKLMRKLKEQMHTVDEKSNQGAALSDTFLTELTKAAKILKEIRETEAEEARLQQVEIVQKHSVWLNEQWKTVSSNARGALKVGIETLSYGEMGLAFQVYFNLGELKQVIDEQTSLLVARIGAALEAALTKNAVSKSSLSVDTRVAGKENALIKSFEEFADKACQSMLTLWHIQRVLSTKFDPVSNSSFLSGIVERKDETLTRQLWHSLCGSIATRLNTAFYKSITIKTVLVGHFPELASVLENLVHKVQSETTVKGALPALGNRSEATQVILKSVDIYQSAFLSASLNRMIESVNVLFGGTSASRQGSLPTTSDARKSIACFFNEIQRCSACGGDSVAPATVSNVAKAVRLMAERAEALKAPGLDVKNVSGACTPLQSKNIGLCCRIQEVHQSLSLLCVKLQENYYWLQQSGESSSSASGVSTLSAALETLQQVSSDAISPIFQSMLEMLDESIANMHQESSSFNKRGGDGSSDKSAYSVYLPDLLMKIPHCRSEYLSRFKAEGLVKSTANLVNTMIEKLAVKLLDSLAKHASLVRPLDRSGRKCLASDLRQIQRAIETNICPLQGLGRSHTSFAAFVTVLEMETEEVQTSVDAGGTASDVDPVVLVHHTFCRSPDQVQSPLEASGLTQSKYSIWMEQHSPADILKGAKDAIEAYKGGATQDLPLPCAVAMKVISKHL
mmetsp:Transcript_14059/g.35506  ORF Transcript_14059/g.35506 Transcript_14059/m.35506 type:complete len:815 (-) Transcript_14059:154-2598(-)